LWILRLLFLQIAGQKKSQGYDHKDSYCRNDGDSHFFSPLPRCDCIAVLLRTAKAFQAPVKTARLDELPFQPEFVTAFRACKTVAALHLFNSGL